jgi:hypothetical protein
MEVKCNWFLAKQIIPVSMPFGFSSAKINSP